MPWIRHRFLDDAHDHAGASRGHTPACFAELEPNWTNLDSMAFSTGRLTVSRLNTREGRAGPPDRDRGMRPKREQQPRSSIGRKFRLHDRSRTWATAGRNLVRSPGQGQAEPLCRTNWDAIV